MASLIIRNGETVDLQYKNFEFAPGPRRGGSPADSTHFKVNLRNRKNWQKRTKTGEHQLNGSSD